MNIFDIFKSHKTESEVEKSEISCRSYMCRLLNKNLHFTSRNTLEPCCSANIGPVLISELSKVDSIKEYTKSRDKYIEMLKSGIIPECCHNCVHIEKYKESNDYRVDRITLNHYTQCNCACIYCTQGNRSLEKIKEDESKDVLYDVGKFVKELYDNGLIDRENLYLDFQGGNISCLKNYETLIDLFVQNGVGTVYIPTNNIVYLPSAEKLIKAGKGSICTALDSGCAETYLRIKQVDKFTKSVENLKRYVAAAGATDAIIVKYIIVSGYNDTVEEIDKFTDLMHEIGITQIITDIDYRDIIDRRENGSGFEVPQHYYEMIKQCRDKCSKYNIKVDSPPYTKSILEKGCVEI